MSTIEGGGNIVNNGLILCLDSANTKSYNGVSNTWYDLSRDYKTCTLVNGSTFSGGSIVFDGIDDYVNINFYNWFPITTQKVTIESWVKSIGSTGVLGGIISLTYGLTLSIRSNANGGSAYFRVYDNVTSTIINTASTGINLNDNKWHHIVGTNDGVTSKIYVDGVLNNSASSPFNGDTNPIWYNNPLIHRIGAEVNDYTVRLFNGNIGVVRVYNKSLTDTEIEQNYNATKKRYGL